MGLNQEFDRRFFHATHNLFPFFEIHEIFRKPRFAGFQMKTVLPKGETAHQKP
jgi:hypothetical protein